jgi:tRNA-dihydrouridine synthase A
MLYSHQVSIAPMMDCTDRHFRYFLRLISKKVVLYTEMVVAQAILHGPKDQLLKFRPEEHPLVLQLGGSNPKELAEAAKIAEQYGYDEINLNVGCPSDRVQSGRFGACLMKEPGLVAECIQGMKKAVRIPVTVKTRIGVDDLDDYDFLYGFIKTISEVGCEHFIIHARKAWLNGLSPKENRTIPPLDYDRVYQIKQAFPHLFITINGGVKTVSDIQQHLTQVDGVMIGREAYSNPYCLASVDQTIFGEAHSIPERRT